MRVCRFLAPGAHEPAVGIITGSTVAEIPAAGQDLGVLLLLQKAEIERLHHSAGAYHDLDSLKMLPPVGRPGKLLMLAGNYHPTDSREEVDLDVETPKFFIKPSTALVAHDETIPHNPIVGGQIEEIELGAVIGRPGKNISREDAYDHIFGFTIVNDVSARALRFSDQRSNPDRVYWFDWLNGKWLDTFAPQGPWMVTSDEIRNPQDLNISTYVNGLRKQFNNTGQMLYPVASIVEYISAIITLEPGDIISTGTISGVGATTGSFLSDGDRVEIEISRIGVLRNNVGDSKK
jgi:2-keto-4-pentenoate hydratase/2-oxohepta-3-ene-1,7-dioic acid hydratase in catechol pathway